MNDAKNQFRIGTLAKELGIERFVIRFWEKEFGIFSHRSPGGQRFYQQKDFEQFKLIKELLHEKGLTIAGAKKILKEYPQGKFIVGSSKTTMEPQNKNSYEIEKINQQLIGLKKALIKLRDLL
jgi:DNA-binding transcriptional MerR regulator